MPFATFDERAYPLVVVTFEEPPSKRACDAFLEYVEDLLERPERPAIVVRVDGPRIWALALSDRHEDLIEDLKEEAEERISALAYVTEAQFVARALDFALRQARLPFPVRVFDDLDVAKAWAQGFVG